MKAFKCLAAVFLSAALVSGCDQPDTNKPAPQRSGQEAFGIDEKHAFTFHQKTGLCFDASLHPSGTPVGLTAADCTPDVLRDAAGSKAFPAKDIKFAQDAETGVCYALAENPLWGNIGGMHVDVPAAVACTPAVQEAITATREDGKAVAEDFEYARHRRTGLCFSAVSAAYYIGARGDALAPVTQVECTPAVLDAALYRNPLESRLNPESLVFERDVDTGFCSVVAKSKTFGNVVMNARARVTCEQEVVKEAERQAAKRYPAPVPAP